MNPKPMTPAALADASRGGNNRAPRCRDSAPKPLDFQRINSAALTRLPDLLARWLPDGKRQGHEWVARNPRRSDKNPGSFAVNITTGKWADFAGFAKGGDVVSLAAYLGGLSPRRVGVIETDLADWIMSRRHPAPGSSSARGVRPNG